MGGCQRDAKSMLLQSHTDFAKTPHHSFCPKALKTGEGGVVLQIAGSKIMNFLPMSNVATSEYLALQTIKNKSY